MTREEFVALALSYAGCSAADPERYLDLVGPDETSQVRAAMLTMSGCALTARGLWRKAGIRHPRLSNPYRIGQAVADIVEIGRAARAWEHTDGMPQPGDVVLVGDGAHEHVFTVTSVDGMSLESIDGGQIVPTGPNLSGVQTILTRSRTWSLDPESAHSAHLLDHAHSTRPVFGWVNFDHLSAMFG